jgi:ABC-type nitrate/sulfonate/bicarbonate transport system substrate-binding protein
MPLWLVEGFADYVGYAGVDVPTRVAAQELRAAIRSGHPPTALPADAAFAGTNPKLAQAYEQAWLAASLLARRYGPKRLVQLYKVIGNGRAPDDALRTVGTDLATFTADWRRDVRNRLA